MHNGVLCFPPSSDLLLQGRWPQLPSALEGLTSVFGMGTGVSPPLSPLGNGDKYYYKGIELIVKDFFSFLQN